MRRNQIANNCVLDFGILCAIGLAVARFGVLAAIGIAVCGVAIIATANASLIVLVALPIVAFVPRNLFGDANFTPIRIMIVLALVATVAAHTRRERSQDIWPSQPRSCVIAASSWTLVVITLGLVHYHPSTPTRLFDLIIGILAPVLLARAVVRTPRDAFRLLNVILVAATAASALACTEGIRHRLFFGTSTGFYAAARFGHDRVQSVFPHALVYGTIVTLILPLIVAQLYDKTGRHRSLWRMAGAINVSGLFLTFGRGPWIAAVVGLCVMTALIREARGFWIPGALGLGILLVSLLPVGGQAKQLVSEAFTHEGTGATVGYRAVLRESGLQFAREHPTGVGPGGIRDIHLLVRLPHLGYSLDLAKSIDNEYLIVLLECGYLGLGVYVTMIGLTLWGAVRTSRLLRNDAKLGHLAAALAGGQAAMVVLSGTVATITIWAQVSLLFSLLVGLSFSLRRFASNVGVEEPSDVAVSQSAAIS